MWPFSKKKESATPDTSRTEHAPAQESDGLAHSPADSQPATSAAKGPSKSLIEKNTVPSEDTPANGGDSGASSVEPSHFDSMTGDTGPFDARREDLAEFDFSDFAKGDINLGSIIVPIPHTADVQVEVGETGPRAIHIATEHGRLTPVAFAAPRSGGLWEEQAVDIEKQLADDGLDVERIDGPWGVELVATGPAGVLRMIGVNGNNWMLRMTAVGTSESQEELADVARGVVARTIVNRGDGPMPAGQTLVVALPQDMAEELKNAMAERERALAEHEAAQSAAPGQTPAAESSPETNSLHSNGNESGAYRTTSAMDELSDGESK